MIAQIGCKAVRYNGPARLQFSRPIKRKQGRLVRTQSARRPAVDKLVKGGKAV
jgi:hypothetical protein